MSEMTQIKGLTQFKRELFDHQLITEYTFLEGGIAVTSVPCSADNAWAGHRTSTLPLEFLILGLDAYHISGDRITSGSSLKGNTSYFRVSVLLCRGPSPCHLSTIKDREQRPHIRICYRLLALRNPWVSENISGLMTSAIILLESIVTNK